jgi:hypothetical protein
MKRTKQLRVLILILILHILLALVCGVRDRLTAQDVT